MISLCPLVSWTHKHGVMILRYLSNVVVFISARSLVKSDAAGKGGDPRSHIALQLHSIADS